MRYITVTTPDNIEIEYRLAGLGSRLGAAAVDIGLQSLVALILIGFGLAASLHFHLGNILSPSINTTLIALLLIALFLLYFGYYIFCELVMNGQSLGKKLFRLRVIRENGRPIGLTQSLVRNILRYVVDAIGVGPLMIFFSKKHKRLGDFLASTIVIAENPSQIAVSTLSLSDLLPQAQGPQAANSGTLAYRQNFALEEDETYLLKEYFNRKETFLDGGQNLKNGLLRYFAKKWDIPESMLSEALLREILQLNVE